ncbi:hypothetical protein [Pedobacter sp.]|uniref:hypothetical protein n=1 Tax=Pedobacter sp. TaxID=1411316 RepID=UPI003BA8B693
MKSSILIFFCLFLAKLCSSQSVVKNIDYQYYRDDKTYYAFEIYRNPTSTESLLYLNFSTNKAFKKVEKVYLLQGSKEHKLKIKVNDKTASSDNPEVKFYSLIINPSDFISEDTSCNTTIVFKLDDGATFSLPFNKCLITESLAKN